MPSSASTHSDRFPLTPMLDIVDLSFTYTGQTQPTLANVHLSLKAGELVVLVGATGSGKSTLLNCLTGIAPEHTGGTLSGQVLYQGQDITTWSVRERSQVMGIMLQNVETQLFTDQVWEEVVFGLENWNLPPAEMPELAGAALREFDLMAQHHWSIRQLSAGQKQRLLLSCLLTRQPALLLLDEPFAFLDQAGVRRLLQFLQQRVQHGQTILLIEHRLELLRDLCDRAYRIHAGSVTPVEFAALPAIPALYDSEDSEDSDPAPHANVVLQTHQLSWGGYPPFPDLQVYAGDIVLLQGENGCGKTTLLKLLSGLLKPSTGSLTLLERDATRRSVVRIAQIVGFVLQNPNHQLFAESVAAEIMQPGVDEAYSQQLLNQLNLSHCADHHPHALSQGQKRRLALGAVLARQPRICLLDEIMVGQDATSLELMLNALKTFTAGGGTLIFTSHDPGVAAALHPRVIPLGLHRLSSNPAT